MMFLVIMLCTTFFNKNEVLDFFKNTQNCFASNQISLRGSFVFKTNVKLPSITSYKGHCCSFIASWVIKQQISCILDILKKTPNFGRAVRTLKKES